MIGELAVRMVVNASNGPAGDLILIKRTELSVQQYDGHGAFFKSTGFDKYASKMYWRRY